MELGKSKKIEGFDRWEVESAARTLIEAEEIRSKPKFLKVVLKEVDRQVKVAERVALEKKTNANLAKFRSKM